MFPKTCRGPENLFVFFQDATTKVFFALKKKDNVENFKGQITFNQQITSSDGDFDLDLANGKVTIHIPGVYQFSFSGQGGYQISENTYVIVLKNGNEIFDIWDSSNSAGDVNNLSYVWMMEMQDGDTIQMNAGSHLYTDQYTHVTFTGELIEKQLSK